MLYVSDAIVNVLVAVVNIFNKYFTDIAYDIGFNDSIPVLYSNDDDLGQWYQNMMIIRVL